MAIRRSPPRLSRNLSTKARAVRLLLMDVDGVLTDGRIYYLPAGRPASAGGTQVFVETKTFHSRDGLGIRLAHDGGLKTGIITGRASPVVAYRASELEMHFLRQNARTKLGPYREILQEAGLRDHEVCYIGDDLVDLPILIRVGLAVGVSGGHPFLRSQVDYVTRNAGGMGAVRETVELILSAQGKFKSVLDRFMDRHR
jgi:3-deoxy-D-manno-octulosonate 8-phosphate phosphatase (KDO 8-P phosphatase)